MTSIEKLNAVLRWLAVSSFAKPFATDGYIHSQLQKKFEELAEQDDWGLELHRILDKLEKDGYVKTELRDLINAAGQPQPVKQKLYSITFEGEQFNRSGGYADYVREMGGSVQLTELEQTILSDTLGFITDYREFVFFFVMDKHTKWKDTHPAFVDRDHSSVIATRIYNFFLENGFAEDIDGKYKETILLTEKGRSLKKSGSYEAYLQEIKDEVVKKRKREKWADRKAWWDAHGGIWITIIVALIALCGFFGIKSCNRNAEPTAQQKNK